MSTDPLAEAVKDVCWRAVRYGETEDGDTAYYLVTKGAMHRLVAACPGAAFRADDRATLPDTTGTEEALASLIADGVVAYFKALPLTANDDPEVWADEHEIARGGQARLSARAVLASDWLAAHDAQVRADERQKVAARLADEGAVEKVAEAICISASGWPDHHGAWTDEARAALDVIAGLIGGEDE